MVPCAHYLCTALLTQSVNISPPPQITIICVHSAPTHPHNTTVDVDRVCPQKECKKRVAAALISTAYRAPRLSLCVRRTFTLSLKMCCFSKDCGAFPVKMQHVSARWQKSRRIGKKRHNMLPAQIQRQTIKVQRGTLILN